MYTHVYVSHKDAERLFATFAPKPPGPGEWGVVTEPTLEKHFARFSQTYLDKLAALLEDVRSKDLFVLKFNDYLPYLPTELVDMEIEPVKVEIVRMNSAPTKARAGYYEVPSKGLTASVERVFPTQYTNNGPRKMAPLYVQNIRVSGPSLKAAQEFNSKLSMGFYARSLVNAFE